ncbi:hypothetical protein RDE2_35620 [Rhodococcus sp. RDE2]|nr:hypothetical protein RDE2_35620 [Rhodococcus sp. RDE2]
MCNCASQIRQNCSAVENGKASPATKTVRSETQSSRVTEVANTASIDGTNDVAVTDCSRITRPRYTGSR